MGADDQQEQKESGLRILFLSQYFPPEIGAPSARVSETIRYWPQRHKITVLTAFPNHPEGKLYPGFTMKSHQWEEFFGHKVLRCRLFLAANKGLMVRGLAFLSFMLSSFWNSRRTGPQDVVLATSPQLLVGLSGWLISLFKRCAFVLEVRDIWPESIVAVGAMKRNLLIRILELLEMFLYRRAKKIVVVTHAFKDNLVARGINPEKIFINTNGILPDFFVAKPDQVTTLREKLDLKKKVVVSYVGTIGMAHGVGTILECAKQLQESHPEIHFVLAGAGAEANLIEKKLSEEKCTNLTYLGKIPREDIPALLGMTDISLVMLKDTPLFRTVIPSKLFEAFGAGNPVILGVEGEAQAILEASGGGVAIPPEDVEALAREIKTLAAHPEERKAFGKKGFAFVRKNYDRRQLAKNYIEELEKTFA